MRWKKDDTCLSEASCVISFPPLAVARELRGTIPASPGTPVRTLTAYFRQPLRQPSLQNRTATGNKHLRLPPISSALSRYHLLSKLRQPSLHLLHHLCILLKLFHFSFTAFFAYSVCTSSSYSARSPSSPASSRISCRSSKLFFSKIRLSFQVSCS